MRRLRADPGLVRRLHEVADGLRAGLQERGLDPLPSESGIVAVLVGETDRAIAISERLEREFHLLVTGFGYPVVPEGTARIRLQASAAMDGRHRRPHRRRGGDRGRGRSCGTRL